MMDISGKLIDGVMELTKLMAHGAMHEACLIEVVRTVEDEAIELVKDISDCATGNGTLPEVDNYIRDNNATVIDIDKRQNPEVQEILRRMLDGTGSKKEGYKDEILKKAIDTNIISNDVFKTNE